MICQGQILPKLVNQPPLDSSATYLDKQIVLSVFCRVDKQQIVKSAKRDFYARRALASTLIQ